MKNIMKIKKFMVATNSLSTGLFAWFIKCLDLILLILVISFLMNNISDIIINLIETISKFYLSVGGSDIILTMSDNINNTSTTTPASTSVTQTQIIHNDGSWANTIRTLFIYGTGAMRLQILKGGGTATSKFITVAGTVGADYVSKILNNTINDPGYVREHYKNWRLILGGDDASTAYVYTDSDKVTSKSMDEAISAVTSKSSTVSDSVSNSTGSNNTGVNKFISDDGINGIDEISNKIFSYIMDTLRPILEPVKVSYSNEILANQIYDISILLFVLSVLIMILFIAFIINMTVLIYSDRLLNYFTNRYIRWYITLNKKLIGIELIFLGSSILYFMYILSYGIHFIATHPIIIS